MSSYILRRNMDRKIAYSIIIGTCLVVASVWYFQRYTWTAVSMDGASGGGFGAGGRGIGYSSTTWKSTDGIMVDEVVVSYSSSEEARKDFEEELKGDGAIVEQDSRRIVKVSGNPQTREGAAEIIELQGEQIRHINAVSLRHALTFEKS
jgi:hypothetical protein